MAEPTILQLMDFIEDDDSIQNYLSRWRELRKILEIQERQEKQLPTRSELLARIQELETAGRDVVTSVNGSFRQELTIAKLAALLNNTEKE